MLNSEQATQTTVFSVKHSVITLKALLLISPEKTWQIETCFTITHIGFSFCFCHFCDITLILDVVTLTQEPIPFYHVSQKYPVVSDHRGKLQFWYLEKRIDAPIGFFLFRI